MCLRFLSATPFYSEVSLHKVWWIVPAKTTNTQNLLEVYSSPKSYLKHLIIAEYCVLTRAQKVVYISKNSEWCFIK
jgi:hypothetical protein